MLKIIPPPPRSQWWIDNYGRQETRWALLQVDESGEVTIFNGDAGLRMFETVRAAEIWLTLQGYDCLDEIQGEFGHANTLCEDLFNELENGIPRQKLRLVK
ncbi:MAG: hypothetical protein OQK12_04630 [Motiliproteus sp.]|nr:hypothetical protein [Motiliproteus sp.]MCW9053975.1 hypothetical protein [Motiliproteus sp.]